METREWEKEKGEESGLGERNALGFSSASTWPDDRSAIVVSDIDERVRPFLLSLSLVGCHPRCLHDPRRLLHFGLHPRGELAWRACDYMAEEMRKGNV